MARAAAQGEGGRSHPDPHDDANRMDRTAPQGGLFARSGKGFVDSH